MSLMAGEPSFDAFVDLLQRSKIFDAVELRHLTTQFRTTSAREFADALIRTGDLTHYQADKLLCGHWQGLVIGPYTVLAPLGRGGMGTVVYLARDRRMTEALGDSVLVALKLLPDRRAVAEPRSLARFRREMELGRRVNHPNVVRTLAAGDLDKVHYLALEYVPGQNLRQLVAKRGPLPVGEAAHIFADVAAGLTHLHERGMIHRDVKPGNVMVRPDDSAVLLDLGLAIAMGEPLPEDPAIAGGRGYIVGTMDYLAPEQARNAVAVDPAADLYALGCTLFFALTGTTPFPAATTKEKVRRHLIDLPPPLPNVVPEFADLVQRLMAKAPSNRPASASQLRKLLLPWVTAGPEERRVDAIAAADEPGGDVGLWETAPGEELPPKLGPEPSSDSFARLDDTSNIEDQSEELLAPGTDRVGWFLLVALVILMGLVLFVAMLRRL